MQAAHSQTPWRKSRGRQCLPGQHRVLAQQEGTYPAEPDGLSLSLGTLGHLQGKDYAMRAHRVLVTTKSPLSLLLRGGTQEGTCKVALGGLLLSPGIRGRQPEKDYVTRNRVRRHLARTRRHSGQTLLLNKGHLRTERQMLQGRPATASPARQLGMTGVRSGQRQGRQSVTTGPAQSLVLVAMW